MFDTNMSLTQCVGSVILLVVLFQLAAATPTWHVASDGNSYLIESDSKYNWLQAHDLCARQDLQLAVIDSAAKNGPFDALLRKVFAKSPNLWLGLHDEFNKDQNTARPFYTVSTGNKLNYGNWHSGEPNNLGKIEHCAHIHSATDFKWNDKDCKEGGFGYVCEKHQLTIKYSKDLEQKRLKANQQNTQVQSNYRNTENEIQNALRDGHTATNDILLGFDNSVEEIFGESKNSISEIVKKKPYLIAVIADVGDIVREILEETHKGILRTSEESRESIKHVQIGTENSTNDASGRFASILSSNSNEIDNILV